MSFEMAGMDELMESLKKAVKKYPDIAEEKLEETAKKYKARVAKITRSAVDTGTGRLIKGYKLDKLTGYDMNMEKNFRATAPHFHLIENGHEIITPRTKNGKPVKNGGRSVGFVAGRQIVKQASDEWKEEIVNVMQEIVTEVTKGV